MYYGISNEEAPFSNTNSTSHSLVHLNKSVFSSECHLRAAGERIQNIGTTAPLQLTILNININRACRQCIASAYCHCETEWNLKPAEIVWRLQIIGDWCGLVVHVMRHVHGKRMSHTGQPELGVTVNNTLRLWSLAPPPDVPVSLCPQLHKYK